MKIGPKRRANALCCATSISWSRKNTTQCSFSASRISPTVPSSSSRATSTPKISAPPAPEIGFTSIRLFRMAFPFIPTPRLHPVRRSAYRSSSVRFQRPRVAAAS
jgi:hypothetical protein